MKIEIEIPKFHEHRIDEFLDFIKEGMDMLGIWQYNLKVNNRSLK